jgi:hypothetical protein
MAHADIYEVPLILLDRGEFVPLGRLPTYLVPYAILDRPGGPAASGIAVGTRPGGSGRFANTRSWSSATAAGNNHARSTDPTRHANPLPERRAPGSSNCST